MMELKIGDEVCIAVPENASIRCGRAGVKNADTGKITGLSGGFIIVQWLTGHQKGSRGWKTTSEYLKLTAPETNRSAIGYLKR